MNPLRAILVDDEPPARRRLRQLLSAHPVISIVGEADTVDSAAWLIEEVRPDVIFLDIQMSPQSGFDLLPHLVGDPALIFVTAFDNHAVRAFEANALDYLLKPVHPDRLAETIRRLVKGRQDTFAASDAVSPLKVDDLLPLKDGGLFRMAKVHDIVLLEAEASYTKIWLQDLPPMMILRNLSSWEQRLPSPPFVRLDRSFLLNLDSVASVQRLHRDETEMTLQGIPTPFRLGRTASIRLFKLLGDRG